MIAPIPAFLTAALDRCAPKDCPWMQDLQEQAFAVASEDDRRSAVTLASNITRSGD